MKKIIFNSIMIMFVMICANLDAGEKSVEKKLGDFSKICYEVLGNLSIKQGKECSLTIKADEEYFKNLKTYVSGDTLHIEREDSGWFGFGNKNVRADFYVTVNKIERIENGSAGNISISNLKVDDFSLENNSSGKVTMQDISCQDFTVGINSSGTVGIDGAINAADAKLQLASSGDFSINSLSADDLEIEISSSGSFNAEKIKANGDLSIQISSHGNVKISELNALNDFSIHCSSSGDFSAKMAKDSTVKCLELYTNSSGSITIGNLKAEDIEARISSSGDIRLQGEAENQEIRISSSGRYLASDLKSKTAELRNSSSSNSSINVSEELHLRLTGSGDITVIGKPKMTLKSSGSGRVITKN